jgi:hypothetical protein
MTGYQYTLIKYMRNAASGECVNVGLAFLAPEERFLCVRFNQSYNRISEFFLNAFEGDHYCNMVRALAEQFDSLADSLRDHGDFLVTARDLPVQLSEIMTIVLPQDSTAFRWGPVYGGVTRSVEDRFNDLFAEFVTRHDGPTARQHRQESQMRDDFERGS